MRRAPIQAAAPGRWNAARANLTIWLLAFALVWAQSLGLWHGVVHGSVHGGVQSQASVDLFANAKTPANSSFFQALFGKHHDGADCRLFDQLSHGDALSSASTLALSLVAPVAPVVSASGLAVARWFAHFQARAPPFVR